MLGYRVQPRGVAPIVAVAVAVNDHVNVNGNTTADPEGRSDATHRALLSAVERAETATAVPTSLQ